MSDGTVHIIDDDADVRKSIGFLLATACFAVRLYDSADAFLRVCDEAIGCVLTDVRMPGTDGISLLREMQQRGQTLPVIVMTGHADISMAVKAMKEGAIDFIEKPFQEEALLQAIKAAFALEDQKDLKTFSDTALRTRLSTLSPRERQVLEGLVGGLANKAIAYRLGLSARTVEVHRANVMTKMGAESLSHLVRMAVSLGVIES